MSLGEDHEGTRRDQALGIGMSDHGRLEHRIVLGERALDLERETQIPPTFSMSSERPALVK